MLYDINEVNICAACSSTRRHHKFIGRRMNQSQGFSPRRKIGLTVSVLRCSQCGLIFSAPQLKPLNINSHYDDPADYFSTEELVEDYFLNTNITLNPEELFDQWLKQDIKIPIHPFPGMKGLDIGVGHGKTFKWMESVGFETWGIEPSRSFYLRLVDGMRISPERLKNQTVEDASFPDCTFNYINFGAVLEHLYSPREALMRAAKWLSSDGVIHCEVPSANWLGSKVINGYYSLIGSQFTTHLSPLHAPFHLYEFTVEALACMGRAAGLEIYKLLIIPCGSDFVPPIFRSSVRYIMEKTKTGMQIEVFFKKTY